MHTSVIERKEQPVRGDRPWNGVSMASAGVAEESYSKNPRGPRNKGAECVLYDWRGYNPEKSASFFAKY